MDMFVRWVEHANTTVRVLTALKPGLLVALGLLALYPFWRRRPPEAPARDGTGFFVCLAIGAVLLVLLGETALSRYRNGRMAQLGHLNTGPERFLIPVPTPVIQPEVLRCVPVPVPVLHAPALP